MNDALQGEVWFCEFEPSLGRAQAGRRPALVVSVDQLGAGPSGIAIVVPLTTTPSENPIRPAIESSEGGLQTRSWALPDMVRSIDRSRLIKRWGRVSPSTLDAVAGRVQLLVRT